MERIIKVLIIMLIVLIVSIICGFVYLKFIQEEKIPVLAYHNVVSKVTDKNSVDISVKKFEEQMKYLKKHHYKTLTMDEFYDWKVNGKKVPRKSVLIVFDDGYRDMYENAFPILKKYDLKATVFVIGYTLELKNLKDRYMSLDEVKNIADNYPNISIESHSYSLHENKRAHEVNYEIAKKDMDVMNSVHKDMKYYAYPFGIRNADYIKALEDSGYKLAFTFGPYDFATKKENNYEVSRIGIFESTSNWKLKLKLILHE